MVPHHLGIIMDGNGRWAKARKLPRSHGHSRGMERMIGLVRLALAQGVGVITLYALSTENLSRPKEELEGLFDLFRRYFSKSVNEIASRGVRVRVIGDVSVLPLDVQKMIERVTEDTHANQNGTVCFALNYGSRGEILRAVNLAIENGKPVDSDGFSQLLYTQGLPDLDFVIRTGNERRLSNFLLYQSAYAELYFSEKMFPDFTDGDLLVALNEYENRKRRFGRIDDDSIQKEKE